jgi:deazaflavin-dependent oxidoreductase (nitroreductase family)
MKKIGQPAKPKGITRFFARLPIQLYQLGLGWLLGGRFIRLTHTGRKSGKARQVVLEVVRYDRTSDTYYVASGWGEKSDWFQNILQNPKVEIQVARRKAQALAERLKPEQGEQEMLDYGRRHPRALQTLARVMGYQIENSEADIRQLGRTVPMVAFHVTHEA